MSENIICPSCKGKGHVLNAVMLLNVVALVLSPFERSNPDGMTREECSQCDGRGCVPFE